VWELLIIVVITFVTSYLRSECSATVPTYGIMFLVALLILRTNHLTSVRIIHDPPLSGKLGSFCRREDFCHPGGIDEHASGNPPCKRHVVFLFLGDVHCRKVVPSLLWFCAVCSGASGTLEVLVAHGGWVVGPLGVGHCGEVDHVPDRVVDGVFLIQLGGLAAGEASDVVWKNGISAVKEGGPVFSGPVFGIRVVLEPDDFASRVTYPGVPCDVGYDLVAVEEVFVGHRGRFVPDLAGDGRVQPCRVAALHVEIIPGVREVVHVFNAGFGEEEGLVAHWRVGDDVVPGCVSACVSVFVTDSCVWSRGVGVEKVAEPGGVLTAGEREGGHL
jgi:hypothetical protein